MAFLKVVVVVMAVSAAFCLFGAVAAGAYLLTGGVATVSVDTPEVEFVLPVPLRLVDMGLGVAQVVALAAPHGEWDHIRHEIPAELDQIFPVLEELIGEFGVLPEGEIVSVSTENENVLITSRRGRLKILVDTPDVKVRVTLPLKAVSRIANKALALAEDNV